MARATGRLPVAEPSYPNIVETMELETGDTADYRTMPEGIELEVLDADEKRLAMLFSAGTRLRLCCAGCMPVSWTVWAGTPRTVCRNSGLSRRDGGRLSGR